jgi:hypothetical protein
MMTEDLRVVCDRCGGWQIHHRRKTELPVRHLRLSEWAQVGQEIKAVPAGLRAVEMVAECSTCHFTVEYSRMESS